MRRLFLLLVTLLSTGLIAAGCGDDEDDGGGDDSPPAAQTQEQNGGSGDPGGGGDADLPASADAAAQAAIENCKQSIDAQPQLSDDVKADLAEICEEAASGDEEAVRQASKDVCIKIVEETAPEGPARDQALAACDTVAQ